MPYSVCFEPMLHMTQRLVTARQCRPCPAPTTIPSCTLVSLNPVPPTAATLLLHQLGACSPLSRTALSGQGMNFIGAVLLLHLQTRESDAFATMVVLMQERGLRGHYTHDMKMLQVSSCTGLSALATGRQVALSPASFPHPILMWSFDLKFMLNSGAVVANGGADARALEGAPGKKWGHHSPVCFCLVPHCLRFRVSHQLCWQVLPSTPLPCIASPTTSSFLFLVNLTWLYSRMMDILLSATDASVLMKVCCQSQPQS